MKSKSTTTKKSAANAAASTKAPAGKPRPKSAADPVAKKAAKSPTPPPEFSEPTAEPIHTKESPNARGTHTTAGRHEIREISHRVMGSRQSQRPVERHDQPRKKR